MHYLNLDKTTVLSETCDEAATQFIFFNMESWILQYEEINMYVQAWLQTSIDMTQQKLLASQ